MAATGSQRFAVLLCKVSDDPGEPRPLSFVRDLFAGRGRGGLNDYWISVSGGVADLDGTDVYDWRPLDQTRDDYIATHVSRRNKIDGAIAAFPEVDFSQYVGVVAVFNNWLGDASASGNGVLAGPDELNVTWMAHETGHVLGLKHSYDQSDRRLKSYTQLGEYYDRYDLMSAMNVHHGEDDDFGATGPVLCAANLDRMGWLPPGRLWRPPSDGDSSSDVVELVSLSRPETPGYLAAVVGNLYVEFRTVESWDDNLPRAGVLIHQLNEPNAVILAPSLPPKRDVVDPPPYRQDWQPGQTYAPDDLTLSLKGGRRCR